MTFSEGIDREVAMLTIRTLICTASLALATPGVAGSTTLAIDFNDADPADATFDGTRGSYATQGVEFFADGPILFSTSWFCT